MLRIKRPCSAAPNCAELVESGYCEKHVARARILEQQYDTQRGSSAKRGYDAAWKRFRAWFLGSPENAICADCKQQLASEVHHVKKVAGFPELRLEPTNCVPLCKGCHSARTLRGE